MFTAQITITEDHLQQLVNLINIHHKRKLSRFTSKGDNRPLVYHLERKVLGVLRYSLNVYTNDSVEATMILGDFSLEDMYFHLHSFYQGLVSV